MAPAVNADPVGPSNIARSEAPDALGSRTSTIAGVPLLDDVYPLRFIGGVEPCIRISPPSERVNRITLDISGEIVATMPASACPESEATSVEFH